MYQQVERELAKLHSDVPETIRRAKRQLALECRQRDNLVDFVARGDSSSAVRDRIAETERKISVLEARIAELTRTSGQSRLPSLAWVKERCRHLSALLAERTTRSALVLRELLGPIRLEPVVPAMGKRYFVAHMAFDTL